MPKPFGVPKFRKKSKKYSYELWPTGRLAQTLFYQENAKDQGSMGCLVTHRVKWDA